MLNKPACVRTSTLVLSKVLMYEYCYNYIKNRLVTKNSNKTRLSLIDNDRLMY